MLVFIAHSHFYVDGVGGEFLILGSEASPNLWGQNQRWWFLFASDGLERQVIHFWLKRCKEKFTGKRHAIPNRVKRASLLRRRPFVLLIILWNMDLRLCLSQPRVDKRSGCESRVLGRAELPRAPCSGWANWNNPYPPASHSTENINFCLLKPPPKSDFLISNWTCS